MNKMGKKQQTYLTLKKAINNKAMRGPSTAGYELTAEYETEKMATFKKAWLQITVTILDLAYEKYAQKKIYIYYYSY